MCQLIYDLAPGCNFAFYTAFEGQAEFANGIRRLANEAGCSVIVDDIPYLSEPMFQDGVIAQAVQEVVDQGVPYFASAGNYQRNSWEGTFVDSGLRNQFNLTINDFGGGDGRQTITVGDTRTIRFTFQWDQPYASATNGTGSQNDVDVIVYLPGTEEIVTVMDTANVGGDPIEWTAWDGFDAYEIEIVLWSGEANADDQVEESH